jgi:hypothetical protein
LRVRWRLRDGPRQGETADRWNGWLADWICSWPTAWPEIDSGGADSGRGQRVGCAA